MAASPQCVGDVVRAQSRAGLGNRAERKERNTHHKPTTRARSAFHRSM
ncbi:hypothetical protein DB32_006818 [Sandaracinus amylolyticus]|uniref:Uncharacterized protein n=1 Tax=Sandaracinus amylolyticus TaxID=927083 RepID=A0A0F6SH18_9BACT|nr:hypothetical protein DB32_006818 [Sandaracinus amylolyticus]